METQQNIASKLSTEQIIDAIKSLRDQSIDSLCVESDLLKYLQENFNTVAISNVKKEFLIKDLKQLKKSSLDLAHYAPLIRKMKELNRINLDNSKLIKTEVDAVIGKYVSV
ncbi:MAG TPA: hypothetical protein VGQ59_16360 [Cyclobacteriaceae bacterium]|jgi:hypothetical protein|nr:hypothetical protein [Cyclobacteriaceae bacterium]